MRRAELGDLRLEALELRAAAGIRLGAAALPDAERAARTAVELAPFRESARAALMEVLAARGNQAEALRAFEDARVLLREELGSSPGPALVALHERLLREEPAPVAPPARRARRRRGWSSATRSSRCSAGWSRRRRPARAAPR